MASLATCTWITKHRGLLIVGPTGVGKTWIGCAMGNQACRQGLTVQFYRLSELYDQIADAQHDGTLPKLKLALTKPNLLILNDFGIGDMSTTAAQLLLDVIDSRQHRGSLPITSQYPVDKWHGLFPDQTVADATLDRFVHTSHRLNLKGERCASCERSWIRRHRSVDAARQCSERAPGNGALPFVSFIAWR